MSNRRFDDGSQEWFDSIQRQRMQQKHPNNKSYLDQKVNVNQQPQQMEISDPYIKNIVSQYQNQPHYGPAHMGGQVVDRIQGGNYEVEVDMSEMQQKIMQKQMEFQRQSGNQGFTVEEELMKLPAHLRQQFMPLAQGQVPQINQPQQLNQQVYQNQNQNQVISLREGYPVFRVIQQSFGNTVILARQVGNINSQLASQQYIMKGQRNVYVVPQNQNSINIQEIQNNPRLLTSLVEVHAPPMASLGPLLVLKESITSFGQNLNGRQVITDANQQYFNGRTLLKG